MNAITHDLRLAAATAAMAAPPAKGFWERFLERLYEARMRQVEREIRAHMHLLPDHVLAQAGFKHLRRGPKDYFAR